jgi:acyl-CoA hydrolase
MAITLDARTLDLSQFLTPGDHIFWAQGCGEPTTLIEALIDQAETIGNLSAFTSASFSGILTAEAGRRIKISSMGTIGNMRALAKERLISIIPCHVGQIPALIEEGLIGCDVCFVQVSPPDAEGNHSFGISSDHIRTAVAKAKIVVAEVNDQVPYTLADAVLKPERIDYILNVSRPLVELKGGALTESDQAIAAHAAQFIADGAVIQMGVGGVPDAVLRLLMDRRDLGFHSGMAGDGLLDLIEAGVMTNARKPIDIGVSITGTLMGTKRLYDWAHRNPLIGMRGPEITHGEPVLMRIPDLVTINSAIEIDLTGQVNAEQSGGTYLGGTGGQVDFVRGGSRAPGGRAIIALPATAKGGAISRITTTLSGPVTTARTEVDVIVTEFGAAELKGQSIPERARRMVKIAHPDFQDALDREAHAIAARGF